MAFESLDAEKINVLDSEFSWLNSADIIKKWKNYIHDNDFSSWENAIDSLKGNKIWLWIYQKALELMMNIDVTANSEKRLKTIVQARSELSSNNGGCEDSDCAEAYNMLLEEIFTGEKKKFSKKYKNDLCERYWEYWFYNIFYEIFDLVATYYKNNNISETFKRAPYDKLYDDLFMGNSTDFANASFDSDLSYVARVNISWIWKFWKSLQIMEYMHGFLHKNEITEEDLKEFAEAKKPMDNDKYRHLVDSIKESFPLYLAEFKRTINKDYSNEVGDIDKSFEDILEIALTYYKYWIISKICRDVLKELKN